MVHIPSHEPNGKWIKEDNEQKDVGNNERKNMGFTQWLLIWEINA